MQHAHLALVAASLLGAVTAQPKPEAKAKPSSHAKAPVVPVPKDLSGTLSIDGSSAVFPVVATCATEFRKQAKDVKIPIGISGTSGGFRKFAAGGIAIWAAQRPIKKSEQDTLRRAGIEFLEFPVAYMGLAVAVPKDNKWLTDLTVAELREIYFAPGKAKTWRMLRKEWPAHDLDIWAPDAGSGTFDFFRKSLEEKGKVRDFVKHSFDDNQVLDGLSRSPGSLAFFSYSFAAQKRKDLRFVRIDSGKGPVQAGALTMKHGVYEPFTSPLFVYVRKDAVEKEKHVRAFTEYLLATAPWIAQKTGYVPMPKATLTIAKRRLEAGTTGTCFLDKDGKAKKGSLRKLYK